jgi:hypothetical protein
MLEPAAKFASGMNRSAAGRRGPNVGVLVPVAGAENQVAAREAQLVAEIAAGNIEAPVRELYRRYARRLYRFGMQVPGNPGQQAKVIHVLQTREAEG